MITNQEMNSTMNTSKKTARIAGFLYLIVAVFGIFAIIYVLGKVYIPGDAATTAANVLANSSLVRIGVVADLFQATVFAFLGMTLYHLLKHVSRNAAGSMMILVSIATTIMSLNLIFEFAALLVATDPSYVTAFGTTGSNALVMLLLDMHHYGFLIAQTFFGLWLVPLGYLAYKSGMFPKALGIMLVIGGILYLVDMLLKFLVPDFAATVTSFLIIPFTVAEVWMLGYLLVRGVKAPVQGDPMIGAGKTGPVLGEALS